MVSGLIFAWWKMNGLKVYDPPSGLPVTLAEIREQCRVEDDGLSPGGEDDYLLSLAQAATQLLDGPEGLLGRALLQQSMEWSLDSWPDVLRLPIIGATAIVSVKYTDFDGAEQTIDPADLYIDLLSEPARIRPVTSWPTLGKGFGLIRVRFTAGTTPSSVPAPIRQAILWKVATWFDRRHQTDDEGWPSQIMASLQPYRNRWGLR